MGPTGPTAEGTNGTNGTNGTTVTLGVPFTGNRNGCANGGVPLTDGTNMYLPLQRYGRDGSPRGRAVLWG